MIVCPLCHGGFTIFSQDDGWYCKCGSLRYTYKIGWNWQFYPDHDSVSLIRTDDGLFWALGDFARTQIPDSEAAEVVEKFVRLAIVSSVQRT